MGRWSGRETSIYDSSIHDPSSSKSQASDLPGINPVSQVVKRIPGVGINLVPVSVELVACGRVDRMLLESSRGGIAPVEGRGGAAGEMLRTGDLRTESDARWGSGGRGDSQAKIEGGHSYLKGQGK